MILHIESSAVARAEEKVSTILGLPAIALLSPALIAYKAIHNRVGFKEATQQVFPLNREAAKIAGRALLLLGAAVLSRGELTGQLPMPR